MRDEIKELKKQLNNISQADEFAKYSKIERKILQVRKNLEAMTKEQSILKFQTRAAFSTVWKIISVSVIKLMYIFYVLYLPDLGQITLQKICLKLLSDLPYFKILQVIDHIL